MNNPSGFRLEDGRAVDVEPWEALFGNAYLWPELTHMYLAGYIVAGFLVAAAYAWGWLKGRRGRYERIALTVPLTVAALAAPVQLVVGDWIARRVAEDQPTKLAAFEGLGETTRGAAAPPRRLVRRRRGALRGRDPQAAVAARLPRSRRHRPGPRRVPRGRPASGERRARRVPDDGRHRDVPGRARRPFTSSCWCRGAAVPSSRRGSSGRWWRPARCRGRPDRRLGRRPRWGASRGSSTA